MAATEETRQANRAAEEIEWKRLHGVEERLKVEEEENEKEVNC